MNIGHLSPFLSRQGEPCRIRLAVGVDEPTSEAKARHGLGDVSNGEDVAANVDEGNDRYRTTTAGVGQGKAESHS